MKPIMRSDWIAVLIGMVILQLIFLWEIDISISALLVQATNGIDVVCYNGWLIMNPMVSYHIGLYGIVLNTFFMVCVGIHILLKNVDKIN